MDAGRFYTELLGFTALFQYRADEARPDPCYMGIRRGGAVIHLSSFSGDGTPGGAVYIRTTEVDALYVEFQSKGVKVDLTPADQTWGNREMYVRDPDCNVLRFCQGR